MTSQVILRTLVGSHAHGLATPESDYDYRGVFVVPTPEILSLSYKPHPTSWLEGKEDDTSYELGHFLHLATQCNPTILEVFRAPAKTTTVVGTHLQKLFPSVWEPKRVADAFGGYSLNQRKKFLDDKDGRRWKYAVAYIRVLLQGVELLSTGDFHVDVLETYPLGMKLVTPRIRESAGGRISLTAPEFSVTSWPQYLRALKAGQVSLGNVIEVAESIREHLHDLAANGPFKDKTQDLEAVNKFLLFVRLDGDHSDSYREPITDRCLVCDSTLPEAPMFAIVLGKYEKVCSSVCLKLAE